MDPDLEFYDEFPTFDESDEESDSEEDGEVGEEPRESRRKLPKGRHRSGSENNRSKQTSRRHSRFRSASPDLHNTDDAAERLRAARREIRDEVERWDAFRKSRKEQPRYKETEGRLRPDEWGYVQRSDYGRRYMVSNATEASENESPSQNTTQDQKTCPERSLAGMELLRKDKRFAPYLVPPGKETPLREVVTKHQIANEIQRPQSKVCVDEPSALKEEGKDYEYSDLEDEEMF